MLRRMKTSASRFSLRSRFSITILALVVGTLFSGCGLFGDESDEEPVIEKGLHYFVAWDVEDVGPTALVGIQDTLSGITLRIACESDGEEGFEQDLLIKVRVIVEDRDVYFDGDPGRVGWSFSNGEIGREDWADEFGFGIFESPEPDAFYANLADSQEVKVRVQSGDYNAQGTFRTKRLLSTPAQSVLDACD